MMKKHQTLSLLSIYLLLLCSTLSAELCHPDDKKALIQFKKSFNNAYIFTTWEAHTDCCKDWYLVQCNQTTNRITSFYVINDDDVAGSIPDSVGDLPYLKSISFRNLPKLTGPLPQSIAKLKNLDSIWITKTNLSGPIPNFLGQLPKLNYINLQYNYLTGTIPASLSKLRELNYLALDGNSLTGPIPYSFGVFMKNPNFYLKLSRNQLSSPIPKSLRGVDFTELNLSRNKLTGDASIFFGKNKKLQRVDLSRNQISFNVTNVVFSKELNILDLSHNLIYGSLPQALTKIPYLQQFNVSYNRLCGKIPTGGRLKGLDKYTYAHNKCLCGTPLPACK